MKYKMMLVQHNKWESIRQRQKKRLDDEYEYFHHRLFQTFGGLWANRSIREAIEIGNEAALNENVE